MNKKNLFVFVLFLIIIININGAIEKESKLYLDKILSEEQQKQMGLYKLNEQERLKLSNYIQSLSQYNDTTILALSAKSYMKKQGWREVSIIDMDYIDNKWWIIVSTGFSVWAIELPLFHSNFRPGNYWAKPSIISGISSILDEFGNEVNFFMAKYKQLK